eukprot:809906-Rhodomonas_salina.1
MMGRYAMVHQLVNGAAKRVKGTVVTNRKNTVIVTIPEAKMEQIFQAAYPFNNLQGAGWGGAPTDDTIVSLGLPHADKLQRAGQSMPT